MSIVPSSFARYALYDRRLGFKLNERVYVLVTDGVGNLPALAAAVNRVHMSSHSFFNVGKKVSGGDDESQKRIGKMPAPSWWTVIGG